MNKSYRVVWSKARGALMVVNELTSSVQAKGTKTVVATAALATLMSIGATATAEEVINPTTISEDLTITVADKVPAYQNATVTLENGATLTINGVTNQHGFFGSASTITGEGNLVLKAQGQKDCNAAFGEGVKDVSVNSITITSEDAGIYKSDLGVASTIKAKTIDVAAYDHAFYTSDTDPVTFSEFDTLKFTSEDGYAVNNNGSTTVTFEGGSATLQTQNRGALSTMAEGAKTVFDVDNLTVKANIDGQKELRKTSAVYVSQGVLDVTAANRVEILATKSEGQAGANGIHVGEGGSLSMDAKQIDIESAGRGLQVVDAGSSAVVGVEATESTYIKAGDIAVYALTGGQIDLNGQNLSIEAETASGWLAGLWAQNNTAEEQTPEGASKIVVNAKNTTITATSGTTLAKDKSVGGIGIVAMSNGTVEVNGNLTVNAEDAILTRGYANVLINQDGASTVKLTGNIDFNYDAITSNTVVDSTAKVKLSNADSFWTGRSLATSDSDTADVKAGEVDIPSLNEKFQIGAKAEGLVLELSNGATWNVTGNSFVTTLSLENGGVINAADYVVDKIDINTFNVAGADASTVAGGSATAFNVSKLSVAEGGSLIVNGNLNLKSGENKGTVTFVGGEFSGELNVAENETFTGSVVIDGDVTNKGAISAKSFTLKSGTLTNVDDEGLHAHEHAETFYWIGGQYFDKNSQEENPSVIDVDSATDYFAGTQFFYSTDTVENAKMTKLAVKDTGNAYVIADYSEHFDTVEVSGGVLTLGQKDADPAVIGKLNLESFTQDGGTTIINAGSTLKVTGELNVNGGEFSNAGIIDVTEATKLAALNGVVLEQGGSLEAKSGQFFSTALDEEGKVEEAGKVDLLGLTANGGALALIDAKYNLAYVQSANELLTGAKFDGKLVMRGTLVESETEVKDMTIDQIGSVGDNTVLSQVTGSTEDKNLVIGSDAVTDNTVSTSNSIGVANLDLGAGSSIQVGGDKTLTLVGNGGELVNSTAASTTIVLDNGNLEIGGTDNGTTGGTLKSDVTVGENSNVTISGEADFNLSSNISLTSNTSTASIQDNASVTISKTNIEAGTMDIKSQAKANVETMTLGNGAVLNVNEKANATVGKLEGAGTINVGNETSAGKLTINDASKHTGVIFVDPAWSDDDSLNVIENASSLEIFTRDSTSIASKIIVGTNSIVALGGSAEEAVAAFNAIKDAQGVSWRDVGAALYVGSPITVDGGILVKEGASLDDANGMTAGKIALENHSMLIVNSEAGREGPAITGDVEFSDGSVLGLTNADAGEFTLASGDVVGNDVTVKTDNPFITADLTENGTITAEVAAENGLGALASTGIQAMARRADFVLAQTIADRMAVDQELGTGLNLWADVTGERYEADSLQNGGNFTADTGYGAFGADFALTQEVALGGAIQYGTGSVRSGVSNIKNEIDSYGITAYGSMKFGDAKLVGELAYIKSENDISSSQTALNGKVDADIYSLGVTAQYKLTAGNFSFVPSIGMRVSRLETDAMDIGAVTVDKQKQTLVQVPVALRVTAAEFDTNGWSVAPSFKIAYVPTFGDKEIKVLDAEQDVIDTSPVQGEFGVNARNGNLMLNANMILGGGKDGTSSVGGKIGVKYLF